MGESAQLGNNLIILAEKIINCDSDEKTGENVYRVKWYDNLIPETKMKEMFPDLLRGYKENHKLDDTDNTKEEKSKRVSDNPKGNSKEKIFKTGKSRCKQFSCKNCDESFKKSYQLDEHVTVSHPETLKYPCKFCNKKFQTDSELNWHMLVHQAMNGESERRNRFILPKPTDEPNDSDALSFSCKCCKELFPTKEERDIHQKENGKLKTKQHGNSSSRILERVNCDVCDKVVTKKRLESHKIIYHFKNGKYPCTKCKKRFLNERDLHRHMPIHDDEIVQAKRDKAQCDICGKLLTKIRMENHKLRFHFTDGEYPCKNCEKTFPHLVDLDWHLSHDCSRSCMDET